MGSVAAFAGGTLPTGWLLCDGSAISRAAYAALFDIIGTTYGAGDGATTFALPDLTDKFIEGGATSGTVKSAGLPNIQGEVNISFQNVQIAIGDAHGALNYKDAWTSNFNVNVTGSGAVSGYGGRMRFDASDSNSIYGNSTTVQPPALTMQFAIYTGKSSRYAWLRTA